MSWHYELICDTCHDYTAETLEEADGHESINPGHWVQIVQVENE